MKSRQREMSITRSWARKKSVPRMGFLTSARMNTCTTRKPGKEREIFFFPYVWIEDPLAARSLAADLLFFCAAVAGNTETSAPLSTRKERRCLWQKTERAPWLVEVEEREEMVGVVPGALNDSRPPRFPKPEKVKEEAEDLAW